MPVSVGKPIRVVRQAASRRLEATLRWLTASAFRSMAIFVILTFVPILLLTYYIVASTIRTSRAEAVRSDTEIRDFTTDLLRTSMQRELGTLDGISDEAVLHRALDANSPERIQAVLRRDVRRHAEFAELSLYDLNGVLLGSSADAAAPPGISRAPSAGATALPGPKAAPQPPPLNATGEPWFTAVSAKRQWYTSSAATPPGSKTPVISIAGPVQMDEQLRGVLLATLPVAVIQGWVGHVNIGTDRYIYVLDNSGHVLVGPPQPPIPATELTGAAVIQLALKGESGHGEFVTPIRLKSYLVAYASIPESRETVVVLRPVRFATYLVRVFYDKLALIAVIVFLLAAVSGTLLRSAFQYYLRYTREVESSRTKIEALLISIGEGVFAVDSGLRIIEFNRAATNLTGWRQIEAEGRPYTEIIQLVDERTGQTNGDPVRQAIEQKQSLRVSHGWMLVRRDGRRFPVALNAAPVLDEHDHLTGCVVVLSDVSQERELDRMKTEFISIASHQLRTPLSGIKGALSLVLEEVLGPLNAEQKQYIARAYEANERLIALASELLDLGRIEQGRLQLQTERVDVVRILQGLVQDFQERAGRYQMTVTLEAPTDRPLEVEGDRMRLREVFSNLIDNAIKYTPEQGRVTIRAFAQAPSDIVVEVSDTGVGIPEDKIPQLFNKFSRVQNQLSSREFGSGLGLYFAKSIVDLHRGTIQVESSLGKGTTFRVRLPARAAAAETRKPGELVERRA